MIYLNYFLKETWRRRTIYRLLFQWQLFKRVSLCGNKEVLHISSGGRPTYSEYLYPNAKKVVKTDYIQKSGVDAILDFNEIFPFGTGQFDVVVLCNALYIAEDASFTIREISRILRTGGILILVNPFIANEMPEPHDYTRLTAEGIRKLTGPYLKEDELVRIGERGTSAIYALQPFARFWVLRVIMYGIGVLIDRMIPKNAVKRHPFPLGYLYVGHKHKA